jgi:predicted nucleic acid-binding protein
MSKNIRPRIYVDTNIFLELGLKKHKKNKPERESDLWFFEQMLRAHEDKEIELMTSSITVAECTHIDGNYDEATQDFFTNLLMSGTLVTLIQDSVFIAERARDLRWKHDITKIKGADAIHVASAIDNDCKEFLSWDDEINGKKKLADFIPKLKSLGLYVISPKCSTKLPDKYRQTKLVREPKKKVVGTAGIEPAS